MDANDVLALGLGVTPPWKLVGQRLDTTRQPNQLALEVEAERGALYPCPVCATACQAHDFAEFTWRHLNFLPLRRWKWNWLSSERAEART